jgi:FtsH-binding integral membrane protein
MTPPTDSKLRYLWLALLLLPFIGVAAYGHVDPMAWGIPYFFQLLWVLLSAGIMAIVCIMTEPRRASIRKGRSAKPRA